MTHERQLTAEQVKEIRSKYEQYGPGGRRVHTYKSLAKLYHISHVAIFKIIKRETYKDI